jgi:protein involved in polysaccharide export with SLBB domain
MKKLILVLFSVLITLSLSGQSLSSLTPEQQELYKKYKAQQTSSDKTKDVDDNSQADRTMTGKESSKAKEDDTKSGWYKENNDNYENLYSDETSRRDNALLDSIRMDEEYEIKIDENSGRFIRVKKNLTLEIFGSHFFNKQNLTFEPKLNIPTPPNYILGTYDELIVDITGLYEANYHIKVSPEGFVRIPTVGLINVSGQTIATASTNIKKRLSKIYPSITSGQTQISVALGNIRSIRVTIIGEAIRPGSYTLPSLSTAFNALYACGGPGKMGSMRNIKIIRRGRVVANIDVYSFLVDGINKDNFSLQDEDIIKIEPYCNRTTIKGAVKHPAIFEMLKGESLSDLIRFAGGFTENANKSTITLFRLSNKEKTVIDVKEKEMESLNIESGDVFTVTKTYNEFNNKVEIVGSVYRPGSYALEPDLTVKQLIHKADGIKNDAYLNMATIIRKRENQPPQIISFNLGKVLQGLSPDPLLQKDDSVKISNLYSFINSDSVSIWGAVKNPGSYKLMKNSTIKDLIFNAKGFTEMASTDSIELIRIIKDPKLLLETDIKTEVLKFALDKDLNLKNGEGDFLLQNGDQVIVRIVSGYEKIRMVQIEGEVIQPGTYTILNKKERLSDLIRRAGGFTPYAYPLGAYLVRHEKAAGMGNLLKEKMADNLKRQLQSKSNSEIDLSLLKEEGGNINNIREEISGSKAVDQMFDSEGIVGINLQKIMTNPEEKQNFYLEEGDYLYVPRELQTIRVIGEVLFPTYVGYDKSMSLKDYVSGAGGFSNNAQSYRTYVLYANGSAKSTKRILGIKIYPPIKPGSYIVVPQKPVDLKQKLSTAETVSIMTSVATVATLIFSVLK